MLRVTRGKDKQLELKANILFISLFSQASSAFALGSNTERPRQ